MLLLHDHQPPNAAADRLCAGCDLPGHEVGVLAPCLVTYHSGATSEANYCAECLATYDAAPGYVHACTDIAKLERLASPPIFPRAVAPTEAFARYRHACQRPMRRWTAEAIRDLLAWPVDELDARIMAEERAVREIGRPLLEHETRLIGEVVRDVLATTAALAEVR